MRKRERKRRRVLGIPSAGKEAGKNPASKTRSLLLQVDVCVKEIFEKGKRFVWPRPSCCPRCGGRIWGHGYVAAFFDGFRKALFLRRYRCPDCKVVLRLRPKEYFPRFQASILTILSSLSHRLQFRHWPSLLSRQRGGHWLRALWRKVRSYWGFKWRGDWVEAFWSFWEQGVVPVSRSE